MASSAARILIVVVLRDQFHLNGNVGRVAADAERCLSSAAEDVVADVPDMYVRPPVLLAQPSHFAPRTAPVEVENAVFWRRSALQISSCFVGRQHDARCPNPRRRLRR